MCEYQDIPFCTTPSKDTKNSLFHSAYKENISTGFISVTSSLWCTSVLYCVFLPGLLDGGERQIHIFTKSYKHRYYLKCIWISTDSKHGCSIYKSKVSLSPAQWTHTTSSGFLMKKHRLYTRNEGKRGPQLTSSLPPFFTWKNWTGSINVSCCFQPYQAANITFI